MCETGRPTRARLAKAELVGGASQRADHDCRVAVRKPPVDLDHDAAGASMPRDTQRLGGFRARPINPRDELRA